MKTYRQNLTPILCACGVFVVGACQDDSQRPPSRHEPPRKDALEEGILGPIDLVYVCGNRFLATNSTRATVEVTFRVAGTDETGNLTLRPGSAEDQGFSETELQTIERGAVELYQGDERLAWRRNQNLLCGAHPSAALTAVAGVSASAGEWTAPFTWANVAVHLSLLPTGKVLSWGLTGTPQVWDPVTGSFSAVPSPSLLFCSGHAFLPDGRLLVSGGNNNPTAPANGLPNNNIFNPSSASWSPSTPMRKGRWYPTNTILANGDVVILAGKDEAGGTVREPEVWSAGSVRVLSTAGSSLPLYPRSFLAPNGQIYLAGEFAGTRYLDPTGTGSWTPGPSRKYGQRDYGSAVMYDKGKILYVGGGRTTNTAEIIDLNAAAPAWEWTGSMASARRHLNATVLPTGEVLVTGGSSGPGFNDANAPVHAAEIWNPVTGLWTTLASNTINRVYHSTSILLPDARILHTGSGDAGPDQRNAELFAPPYLFRGPRPVISVAPAKVDYGSTFTVTSPDAPAITKASLIRIGSTTHAFDMNQRFQWLAFTREGGALTVSAPTNRNTAPPGHYLLFILDGNDVPSVAAIVQLGSGSGSPPPPPPPPPSIRLITSGRIDATKQYMTLDWTGALGANVDIYRNGPLLIATPNDGRYTNSKSLPGLPSYTYKVCQTGTTTCSNASTVQFGGENSPPEATFSSTCSGLTCALTDQSTDADGSVTKWSWNFGDAAVSTARNPSHTYALAGSYTVTLDVTDNVGAVGQLSSEVTVAGTPAPIALRVAGSTDATRQYMTLDWTGASGVSVDVYRNGPFLNATSNDGHYTNSRSFTGPATYTYKVCQTGGSTCSNQATVEFR